MIRFITCMLTSALLMPAVLPAEEALFEEKDIYISGLDGYNTFRIPACVVTNDGTVLAFCEGRRASTSDSGDIDLVLKRSLDGGSVWQPMQVVWDDEENTCGNPCPVVDRETGMIWLLMTHNLGSDHESEIWDRTGQGTRTVWVTSSSDDGLTWSPPRDITVSVKEQEWTWYATGPGIGIQLRSGRLLVPCDHGVAVTKDYHSHVIYSDDHGVSWNVGGTVPNPATSESQVVELADGRVMINIRNHPVKTGYRTVSTSKDGGLTWSGTRLDSALVDPACQGSVLRYTLEQEYGKNRILYSGPSDDKSRIRMTVYLSTDDGGTWLVSRLLHEGPSSYSCLTVLPDMTIACMYEGGERHRREKIAFARFNLEWLTNGADTLKP